MTERFEVPEKLSARTSPCPVTGCWWWMGAVDAEGYGHITLNGKTRSAHRTAYEAAKGPIPVGLTIDHLCRNRSCINPEHLEAVANRVNVLRGEGHTAQNARKTLCVRGHNNWRVIHSGPRKAKRVCRDCATVQLVAAYHHRIPTARYYKSRTSNDR